MKESVTYRNATNLKINIKLTNIIFCYVYFQMLVLISNFFFFDFFLSMNVRTTFGLTALTKWMSRILSDQPISNVAMIWQGFGDTLYIAN